MKKLIIIAIGLLPFALQSAEVANVENSEANRLLLDASATGNAELIKTALEARADVNVKDDLGYTPLHAASLFGQAAIVNILIDEDATIDARNNSQETALHLAAYAGYTDVVDILMKYGANSTLLCKSHATGQDITIFDLMKNIFQSRKDQITKIINEHELARIPNKQFLEGVKSDDLEKSRKALLSGANVNCIDMNGNFKRTALIWASKNENLEMIKFLINAKANPDAKNKFHWTALHHAAFNGHIEIIHELIKANATVDARNKFQTTPLLYAITEYHTNAVDLLLKAGADSTLKINENETIFDLIQTQPEDLRDQINKIIKDNQLELLKTLSEFLFELNKRLHFSLEVAKIIIQYFGGKELIDIRKNVQQIHRNRCCTIL